jgi:hypothetical protein
MKMDFLTWLVKFSLLTIVILVLTHKPKPKVHTLFYVGSQARLAHRDFICERDRILAHFGEIGNIVCDYGGGFALGIKFPDDAFVYGVSHEALELVEEVA